MSLHAYTEDQLVEQPAIVNALAQIVAGHPDLEEEDVRQALLHAADPIEEWKSWQR